MSNRDYLRLAPRTTIDSALGIDAEVLSTDRAKFTTGNREIYDLAINTWLLACKEYAPYTWPTLAARIRSNGLVDTVQYFKAASAQLVENGSIDPSDYPLASQLYSEILRNYPEGINIPQKVYKTVYTPIGMFLFLARYLKRLTPLYADKLNDDAVSSFKKNQRRLKLLSRHELNTFIIDLCQDEIDTYFKSIINRRCKNFSAIKMHEIELTPGTCVSLSGQKLRTLQQKEESLIQEYNYNRPDVYRDLVWKYQLGETAYLMTVPKTLTSARTIAPEECLRQAIAHRMFSLRGETVSGINLTDQSVNQQMAKLGSITGEWATIDLSHASDDVTWSLTCDIFRYYGEYCKYLGYIRPMYVNINGQKSLLQSFATMGNSYTFLHETEIFWTIAHAAVQFAKRCGVEVPDDPCVYAYGDDLVVPSTTYPFVVSFLTTLGFTVNEDKSFASGSFRESCGKDYWDGQDVSSPYFPRQPLSNLLNWSRNQDGTLCTTAESLIKLQQRLFDVSPTAAQYIELFMREKKPELGCVPAGTLSMDLWGYDHIAPTKRYIPEYHKDITTQTRRFKWSDGTVTTYVWEERKWKRVVIRDDIHAVSCQYRPVVLVEQGQRDTELVYHEYLAKGPYYLSNLDRLLGVSQSRLSIPAGSPKSSWRRVDE